MFGQLSVFVGGWTVAAAERVCECAEDVVDVLTRLVDRSLVVADGSGRLAMLETVREYAAERLAESGPDRAAGGPAAAHPLPRRLRLRRRQPLLDLAGRRAPGPSSTPRRAT